MLVHCQFLSTLFVWNLRVLFLTGHITFLITYLIIMTEQLLHKSLHLFPTLTHHYFQILFVCVCVCGCPEVILHGWQDIKIQLLPNSCVEKQPPVLKSFHLQLSCTVLLSLWLCSGWVLLGMLFCCSHPQPGSHTPTRLKNSTLCVLQESESAEEESSPGSERGSIDRGPAPQAIAEGNEGILLAVASSSSSSSLTKGSFKRLWN